MDKVIEYLSFIFAILMCLIMLFAAFIRFQNGDIFFGFACIAAIAGAAYLWINLVHKSPKK